MWFLEEDSPAENVDWTLPRQKKEFTNEKKVGCIEWGFGGKLVESQSVMQFARLWSGIPTSSSTTAASAEWVCPLDLGTRNFHEKELYIQP